MNRLQFILAGLFVSALLTSSVVATEKDKEGFIPLCNGKDMNGFVLVGAPAETWSVENGVIKCTGKPNGYFATKDSFKNYVLRFDFRFPQEAGNSGYLLHITGEHKVFPKCVEVQGQYRSACSIFPLGLKGPRDDNAEARNKAIKPHMEWNSIEIISQDGVITSLLNGAKIAECGPYEINMGQIGFQSEGTEIHFRKLRIKEQ